MNFSHTLLESTIVDQIQENILTESNITELVKLVDEEMDDVASEQRKKLEAIEAELADVRRWLDRLFRAIETTDLDVADIAPRIREYRERIDRLEATAEETQAILSERRSMLDDIDTITMFANDMSNYLHDSELTQRKAFINTFVKEVVISPGTATIRYTIPMPSDSPIGSKDTEEFALSSSVLCTVPRGSA